MRTLVWFRSDLRVAENDALYYARSKADAGVVAVFTICPEQWREHDWGTMKVDFIRRSLIELQKSLAELNIPLKIVVEPRFDGVAEAIVKLADETGCDELHFGREYEVNERARDEAVVDAFENAGKTAVGHTNKVLFQPGDVRTQEGKWYSVFTPFKKRLYKLWEGGEAPELLPVPKPCEAMAVEGDRVPDPKEWKAWGYDFGEEHATRPDLWPGGEDHAMKRFNGFVESTIRDYKDLRDSPATAGTSTLSPYLAMGCISPRQVVFACLEANKHEFWKGSKGITHYISEIVWREFYQHILVGFPRVCKHRNFNSDYDQLRWDTNDDYFAAWCDGRTGVPIVDAAMRQLNTTGWMHNRCRMIVAMYLTKNLLLDWRLGERYFMQRLVDGDLASNNGGWQWSSSTGTDAAPYFRVYNPISQSERHDPEGAYIRKFVPELAELDAKQIHDPHERAGDGLFGKLDYPEPIVDLKSTRERAIEVFKAYRAQDEETRVI
ncbi:MAG: deoxyribodipyrimidine photo-lyase [Planctomycetota bacterium]